MSSRGYRLRPAPRRSTRARTRIHWDRLGRIVLVIVIFAILVSYVNPVVDFVQSWTTARGERTALTEQKAENQRLRERLETLDGAEAAERSARRLGMVAEGELPYVIRGSGRG